MRPTMPDLAAVFFARFHQPELRSSGEGSFSRGDAEGAENFLQMTERQGFAPNGAQLFRSNFGFQDQWRGPLGAGQAAWGRRCGAALVIPVGDRVAPPVSSQRVRCARGSGRQIRRSSVDSTLRSLRETIHRSRSAAVLAGRTALKRRRSDSGTIGSGSPSPPPICLCGCVGRCGTPRP
jgi:hypothetical protein